MVTHRENELLVQMFGFPYVKMLQEYSPCCVKFSSKWIIDVNVKPKASELLGKSI